jgi:cbb3-type cytochrome oxidase maturation protein
MRTGQFEDLDGAAERILHDEEDEDDEPEDGPPAKR